MSTSTVNSIGTQFIADFQSQITANMGFVLAFTAGILMWFVVKKWVLGGAHKV